MPGTTTRLADFLPYRLAITSNAVSGVIASEYGDRFGLRVPEWRVMAVLGDAGRLTQRQLVRATLMDKVAVNRACKQLEERGMLARSPNAADGRSHHLALTDDGVSIHAQIWPQAFDTTERIFSCLSEAEREMLRRTLDKVFEAVADREARQSENDEA
ncbi:MarR family transcriptional regulator [Novosphingobium sp.]|uniref:MarR family winged helix-turn-helix transcriptional regulator n=1 Tax=Novosphingobium sp. TaxID=1874826 RepID=UPI0025E78685|nr:MarR family transcriptional regulator [Novosphingobium sp.]